MVKNSPVFILLISLHYNELCLDIKTNFMDAQNQPAVYCEVPGAVSGKSVFAFQL